MIYYVINADNQQKRWASTLSRLNRIFPLNLSKRINRVSAVLGKTLSSEKIFDLKPNSQQPPFYPRSLTRGEIGCYLSHLSAWKQFLDTHEEWAVIFEDDSIMTPSACSFIQDANWIPKNTDIVQLSSWHSKSDLFFIKKKRIKLWGNFELIQPIIPTSFGSQAYLINRKAAQIAIEESLKIRAPVDHMLFDQNSPIAKLVNVWTLSPFVIYQDEEENGSTLTKGRSTIKREVFWKYRILRRFRKFKMALQKIFTLVPYVRSMDK